MEDTENKNPERQENPDTSSVKNVRTSWAIPFDQVRANIAHNPDHVQDLIAWCYTWCIDDAHPITMPEFAKRCGFDSTTVYRILRGTYVDHASKNRLPLSAKMVAALESFKRLETERASAKRTIFVKTPTATRIWNACDLALESQSPVFIVGPSHIGKTWALTNYALNHNHGRTIYVRLSAAGGKTGMMRNLARPFGINEQCTSEHIMSRLLRAIKPNTTLILDEFHQLQLTFKKQSYFACVELIRELYDHTQCGLVLCGTELVLASMKSNTDELKQIFRRGVHKVILPEAPTTGDVRAISGEYGLEFPDRQLTINCRMAGRSGGVVSVSDQPYELLRQLAREQGLKAITERLRYATKLARKARAELGWEHFVKAHWLILENTVNPNDWE